jgi:serine-type D-Ala-D-Ala endopeptidase (penicillin-binding protein 7)
MGSVRKMKIGNRKTIVAILWTAALAVAATNTWAASSTDGKSVERDGKGAVHSGAAAKGKKSAEKSTKAAVKTGKSHAATAQKTIRPRVAESSKKKVASKGRTASSRSKSDVGAHRTVGEARKAVAPTSVKAARANVAPKSFGELYGLHETDDPLDLKSSVAFVMDQDTNEVLLNKNSEAVLPIASLTKLMTAMVVTEAHQSLDEELTISREDIDTQKHSASRLAPGATLTRGEMLHLALMSSENRAAHALGRNYPGGLAAFVHAMNAKAHQLGMNDTRYVEPTGLSSQNQSSARDLAILVKAASQVPLIRQLSTSPEYAVEVGTRQLQYHTTNRLVRSPDWEIGVQKTGYITEAGECLVMQVHLAGRKLIMVLLDSVGKYSRIGDAERIRRWLLNHPQHSPIGTMDSGFKPTT